MKLSFCRRGFVGLGLLFLMLLALRLPAAEQKSVLVYFGTQNNKLSKGIYLSRLDLGSGRLSPADLVAETKNPGFLAIAPNQRFLYSTGEMEVEGKRSGAVVAFEIDPATGQLKPLNQQPSGGAGPCHVTVDKAGRNVLVANYSGGSIASLPIQADGRLNPPSAFVQHTGSSVNPRRQNAPHAHSINLDPANRFAFAADLGLDKVLIYRFDTDKGTLQPNEPPFGAVAPGSGPRHFAFHPEGHYAYVINEIACTVTVFGYDNKKGELKEVQTISTLPPGESAQPGYSTAEVQVHPSGKFLYGSNRGHDTLAVFNIDPRSGKLSLVENVSTQGKTPRNFGIDPTGAWLLAANQGSDNVVVFRVDEKTGRLAPTSQKLEVGAPMCVKFLLRK